jgi:hypothetical protein
MILRLSTKMGKKIGTTPSEVLPPDPNPFTDWSAHLFLVDHVQYILVTNTVSLYSMLMEGRGITDSSTLLRSLTGTMESILSGTGYEYIFEECIAPSLQDVRVSKALNRSVIGSMNDLVVSAKTCIQGGELSLYDTSCLLNEIPFSALAYLSPRATFQLLANDVRPE